MAAIWGCSPSLHAWGMQQNNLWLEVCVLEFLFPEDVRALPLNTEEVLWSPSKINAFLGRSVCKQTAGWLLKICTSPAPGNYALR